MSYGPDRPEYYKRVPVYIDKILKGAKPGELPIEQPRQLALSARSGQSTLLSNSL